MSDQVAKSEEKSLKDLLLDELEAWSEVRKAAQFEANLLEVRKAESAASHLADQVESMMATEPDSAHRDLEIPEINTRTESITRQNQEQCLLLRLPRELRYLIYDELASSFEECRDLRKVQPPMAQLAMVGTCRAIHWESHDRTFQRLNLAVPDLYLWDSHHHELLKNPARQLFIFNTKRLSTSSRKLITRITVPGFDPRAIFWALSYFPELKEIILLIDHSGPSSYLYDCDGKAFHCRDAMKRVYGCMLDWPPHSWAGDYELDFEGVDRYPVSSAGKSRALSRRDIRAAVRIAKSLDLTVWQSEEGSPILTIKPAVLNQASGELMFFAQLLQILEMKKPLQ
ncbi:hypothetical protein BT63DRAFT_443905 [Microthyrium microscopicum]|uniref:Uncharacterized protein n=1 Tax=Microthyrium microscopicum TaxID=703497 RepID=A0A6A6TWJ2_9PEZI|nr:hypothetical protein BT63DRAFT_443905 [Microthyrium microscopicum]